MSGSTGTTSRLAQYTLRSAAAVLLLVGLAGSTNVAAQVDGGQQGPARAALAPAGADAYELETRKLERLAEANERTDRSGRLAPGTADPDRTSRAAGVETKPPPEPEPEPEPESGTDPDPPPSEPVGPVPGSCDEYSGNRATGCALVLDAGYSLEQMSCLDNLWTKESGWNHRAQNPSSGAYGIPQALPGDKMASHGDDWRTNPATQIRWGLDYIAGRYDTPCGAWQFFQNNNWY